MYSGDLYDTTARIVVPGPSIYESVCPSMQNRAAVDGSNGLSYIEEKGSLKSEGAENGCQFSLLREDEETIGWSSSESEDSYIENADILEGAEIDTHFLPHSENDDNPSSDSEDVI